MASNSTYCNFTVHYAALPFIFLVFLLHYCLNVCRILKKEHDIMCHCEPYLMTIIFVLCRCKDQPSDGYTELFNAVA